MRKATNKDNYTKVEILGQYNTKIEGTDKIISELPVEITDKTVFIEPSFGSGNFVKSFRKVYKNKIVAVEIDEEVFSEFVPIDNCQLINQNIYDFDLDKDFIEDCDRILLVGNPPYRTPALSLKDRKPEIDRLKRLYNIDGVKEECIFFIVKTLDVIKNVNKEADVFYILPKTIFQNPTKAFKSFYTFLNNHLNIISIKDIDKSNFENVSQNLILVHFTTNITNSKTMLYNDEEVLLEDFLGANQNIIPYNKIFKKTYLGSVPAESFLLSCKDESKEHFMERIFSMFFEETNLTNLKDKLSYNNSYHLSKIDDKKLEIILSYVNEIKDSYDLSVFQNIDNYKRIKHRNEWRLYFRHESIKKVSFVYLINSNPGESFYFTSNPTSISTDYYGYTDYDANRNSSPGSIRTVPLAGIENNLTDEFKKYWYENTEIPIDMIYEYMIFIYKSDWYKNIKKTYSKFYFGVPVEFMEEFKYKK